MAEPVVNFKCAVRSLIIPSNQVAISASDQALQTKVIYLATEVSSRETTFV